MEHFADRIQIIVVNIKSRMRREVLYYGIKKNLIDLKNKHKKIAFSE